MRRLRLATRACLALLVAGNIAGILVPAGLGWDFANFYDTGRRASAGLFDDLYHPERPILGAAPQGTLAFYGTPLSAWFYVPMSWLPPGQALLWFKIQNALAFAVALGVLFLEFRRLSPPDQYSQARFAAGFACAALLYQPFWTVYRVGGQTTPTVLLSIALALSAHLRARFGWAALAWVVAILIKPAFGPGLILLAGFSGWRFFFSIAGFSAVAGLLSVVTTGWAVHRDFLEMLRNNAALVYPWFYNSSIYLLTGEGALSWTLKLAALASFLWMLHRRRPGPREKVTMALFFALLFASTVWEHYLALLFPFFCFAIARGANWSPSVRWTVAAMFALAASQNLILALLLRDHFPSAEFIWKVWKAAPLLLGWALLMKQPANRRP
ncbi:MAG: DUF2029 domain-containing protein [Acidobacteria bacterium]|nr:DUF2029 domain-containing protein [Acidobacteriota bacterium]